MNIESSCHCGSGVSLDMCCGLYIYTGRLPPTAEALMRSRYTAYVLNNEEYLLTSWHVSTRPEKLNLTQESPVQWCGLEVLSTEMGREADTEGYVEFVARYRLKDQIQRLYEYSHFIKEDGRWFYLSGETKPEPYQVKHSKPGRNSPCPCGSGKKYKRCCGKQG